MNQFISFLLLLSISATVIPLNFHHHEEEIPCDITNIALENDPCHISIYHSVNVGENHCDDESHLSERYAECEFCKFINSLRQTYIASKCSVDLLSSYSNTLLGFELSFLSNSHSRVVFSRGPPSA